MRLTIATWNINSVRLRIDLVARFLEEQAPDVLCLQETKCRDSEFPLASFHKLGYRACRDQRPERLSRRRHRLEAAA